MKHNLDEEQARTLADKIIEAFDGFGLLPTDTNSNDQVNLRNVKHSLVELLQGEVNRE